MDVEWPWQRQAVLEGLDTLAGPPIEAWDHDGTVLETAIHAVVDDTGWDLPAWGGPAGHIGKSVRDEEEAAVLTELIEAICRVSARQGATASDAAWYADGEWPLVRSLADRAASLLRANDG